MDYLTQTENLASGQLLDTISGEETMTRESYELAEIMQSMGLEPNMKNFEIIAADLSRLVRKDPPWSKKYIHSVYHNHQGCKPSPLLSQAISALAQAVDGTPVGVTGSVWVRVLAQPDIQEGVLIPAGAKVVKCARPGCPVLFVKTHPNQKYHDPDCRP